MDVTGAYYPEQEENYLGVSMSLEEYLAMDGDLSIELGEREPLQMY